MALLKQEKIVTLKTRLMRPEPRRFKADTVELKRREVAILTRQCAVLLDAGIPLVRALDVLAGQGGSEAQQFVVEQLRRDLEAGVSLSGAVSKFPRTFTPLFASLVRVGEMHGDMGGTLRSMADFMEKDQEMAQRMKSALTYPGIVAAVAVVGTWLLFTFLVPQFMAMFEQMHLEVPFITRVVMVICWLSSMPAVWLGTLATAGLVYWWLRRTLASPHGRLVWDRNKVRLPMLGRAFRMVALARMARSLAVLLRSGVHLTTALKLSGEASGNRLLEVQMSRVLALVMEGEGLASAMQDSMFDNLVRSLTMVGEESGTLPWSCVRIAEYYEREVDTFADNISSVIEPIFTVVLGIVIGAVCVAIFLPLYGLLEHLGG
jgi:type IV pilus assembly protein PilC